MGALKINQKVIMRVPPTIVGGALATTANAAAGITRSSAVDRAPRLEVFRFTNTVVSLTAANDFGSVKLCDLPNSNLLIVGAVVDLTVTVAGFASDVATAVDLAIGTVTTASAAFSNAGEKDVVPKIDGVGGTATGTVKGANTTTEKNLFVAAGASNALWVNVSDPVTTGTGTMTLNGTITVTIVDTGKPA